jgi:hypothetical protein
VSTSPSASSSESPLVRALQSALDAEHAAVYGYGVVGAKSTGAQQTSARTGYDAHRARRDALAQQVEKQGAVPHAAAAAYALPFPVNTPADAGRLAVYLEEGVAAHLVDLVGAASSDTRVTAAKWLQDAAVAGAAWRGSSVPFPGLPDTPASPSGRAS